MKKYLIFLSVGFLLSSCSKFLDQQPHTLTSAAFYQTADQAEAALAGAYTPLQQEESVGGEEWCSMEAFSDIGYLNDNYPDFIAMTNYATNQNTEGDLSLNSYIWNFQIMKRTGDILLNVPSIVMDDAQKTRILGETNFLKGFAFFTEVKRYGGIPVYDPTNAASSTVRASSDTCWKIIENSLIAATTQLAWDHQEGRPGLGAVWGLLAKVYAFEQKWTEAKAAAETVINSGNHSLVPTYSWLWSIDHQTSDNFQENLWVLGARKDGPDPITGAIYLPNDVWGGTHPEPLGNGWRLVSATNNFYDTYQAGDVRKQVTVAKRNVDIVTYMGATDVLKAPNNQSDVVCVKFMQPWQDGTYQGLQPGLDIPVIRYADVLLLDAEAIMNLNGGGPTNRTVPVSAAEVPFNLVHERAGLAHIDAPTFDDLMYDRKMELAFEGGERFFDLVRWGLAAEILNAAPVEGTYKPARTFVAPKNNLLPYPQREIDVSNGTILQNPGY